jgi:predicted nucleic acid-binding Zn finger protein
MAQEIQVAKRFADGAKIALYGRIDKVAEGEWEVYSMTNPTKHYTVKDDGSCTCPDYMFRGVECKHAISVDVRFSVLRTVREIA